MPIHMRSHHHPHPHTHTHSHTIHSPFTPTYTRVHTHTLTHTCVLTSSHCKSWPHSNMMVPGKYLILNHKSWYVEAQTGHELLLSAMNTVWVYSPSRQNLTGWNGLWCIPKGWGGGIASLKVATHCQTTAPVFQASPPLRFFLTAPIFGSCRSPSSRSQTFSMQNCIQNRLQLFYKASNVINIMYFTK